MHCPFLAAVRKVLKDSTLRTGRNGSTCSEADIFYVHSRLLTFCSEISRKMASLDNDFGILLRRIIDILQIR